MIVQRDTPRIFDRKYSAVLKLSTLKFENALKSSFQYSKMEIESLMASNSRMCKHFGTKTHRDESYTYMSYSEEIGGF